MGENVASKQVSFGKEAMKEFLFDPKWKNLNHGAPSLTFTLLPLSLNLIPILIPSSTPQTNTTYPQDPSEPSRKQSNKNNASIRI